MSDLKTKPAPPAAERAESLEEEAPRRSVGEFLRDMGDFFHPSNLRDHFSREKVSNALKTFAWVAPLTVLIWVWAEREQLDDLPGQSVPIEVRIPGANKVGTILSPADRNVVVTVRGPRGRLDALRAELSQRAVDQRVILDLDPQLEPRSDYTFAAQPLLQRSDFFQRFGVTIKEVSPTQLTVSVSELVTIEAPVQNPPAAANIGLESVYEPSVVRLTARMEDLEAYFRVADAKRDYFVYPDLSRLEMVSKPGNYELKNVPLLPSEPLRGKVISIEPKTVNTTLQVLEPNATWTMPSMPVFLSHPADLLDRYDVDYDPFLERVTLVGKREMIEMLAAGRLQGAAPKARLEVTPADAPPAAQPREKTVQFDLPEGVSVSPADRAKKVRFTVRERSGD